MADKEFADLTAAALPLSGTELVTVVQGGNSRRATVDALKGSPGTYRAYISATVNNVTGDNTNYQIIWNQENETADFCTMNTTTGEFTLAAGSYAIQVGILSTGGASSTTQNASITLTYGPVGVPAALSVRNTNDVRANAAFSISVTEATACNVKFQIEGSSKTADLIGAPDIRTFLRIVKVS